MAQNRRASSRLAQEINPLLCIDLICSLSSPHAFTFMCLVGFKWRFICVLSMLLYSWSGPPCKLRIFFSQACFSNLPAARKSATQLVGLSGVRRMCRLKIINSLVSGRAHLRYIGITGQSCAVIHSLLHVLSPFHSFSLRENAQGAS